MDPTFQAHPRQPNKLILLIPIGTDTAQSPRKFPTAKSLGTLPYFINFEGVESQLCDFHASSHSVHHPRATSHLESSTPHFVLPFSGDFAVPAECAVTKASRFHRATHVPPPRPLGFTAGLRGFRSPCSSPPETRKTALAAVQIRPRVHLHAPTRGERSSTERCAQTSTSSHEPRIHEWSVGYQWAYALPTRAPARLGHVHARGAPVPRE